MAKYTKQDQADSLETLRALLPIGTTVYSNVTKRATSGMSRRIEFYVVADGKIRRITYSMACALDLPLNDDGLLMRGCGYDTAFDCVYSIGRKLWPSGFHTKIDAKHSPDDAFIEGDAPKICRFCLNIADEGDNQCTGADYHRNGDYSGWDKDGGYALKSARL